MTLIDWKVFSPQSVFNQCRPDEVGQFKTHAIAQRLQCRGVQVRTHCADVSTLPDGVLEPGTITIMSVDNRRAEICGGQLAMRMRSPLLKANLETLVPTSAVRAYDYRRRHVHVCHECQFTDRHYLRQHHPRSCEGQGPERRTASPPELAEATAILAMSVLVQLVQHTGKRAARDPKVGWQRQYLYAVHGGCLSGSALQGNSACRVDHQAAWPMMPRVITGASRITLEQLARETFGRVDSRIHVRLCRQISFESRCEVCRCSHPHIRWVRGIDDEVGNCCDCGGLLKPVPFFTFSRVPLASLKSVMGTPLATWGVQPGAVFELRWGNRFAVWTLALEDSSAQDP
jgi:hypothetical protein